MMEVMGEREESSTMEMATEGREESSTHLPQDLDTPMFNQFSSLSCLSTSWFRYSKDKIHYDHNLFYTLVYLFALHVCVYITMTT